MFPLVDNSFLELVRLALPSIGLDSTLRLKYNVIPARLESLSFLVPKIENLASNVIQTPYYQ